MVLTATTNTVNLRDGAASNEDFDVIEHDLMNDATKEQTMEHTLADLLSQSRN